MTNSTDKFPQYSIESVNIEGVFSHDGMIGFTLNWEADIGFGQLTFVQNGDRFICENELMSKNFIKAVFNEFVDNCQLA